MGYYFQAQIHFTLPKSDRICIPNYFPNSDTIHVPFPHHIFHSDFITTNMSYQLSTILPTISTLQSNFIIIPNNLPHSDKLLFSFRILH